MKGKPLIVRQTKKTHPKIWKKTVSEHLKKNKKDLKCGFLYVGGLGKMLDENFLLRWFAKFGKIQKVKLARSLKTGKSMGYGYIKYRFADVARIAANAMDNYTMGSTALHCNFVINAERFFKQASVTPETCPGTLMKIQHQEVLSRFSETKQTKMCKKVLKQIKMMNEKLNLKIRPSEEIKEMANREILPNPLGEPEEIGDDEAASDDDDSSDPDDNADDGGQASYLGQKQIEEAPKPAYPTKLGKPAKPTYAALLRPWNMRKKP